MGQGLEFRVRVRVRVSIRVQVRVSIRVRVRFMVRIWVVCAKGVGGAGTCLRRSFARQVHSVIGHSIPVTKRRS